LRKDSYTKCVGKAHNNFCIMSINSRYRQFHLSVTDELIAIPFKSTIVEIVMSKETS